MHSQTLGSQTLTIVSSEKRAERLLKEMLLQSNATVLFGSPVLSLPHFLEEYNQNGKTPIPRGLQRHLMVRELSQTPCRGSQTHLSYFEAVKHQTATARLFLDAIRRLKKYGIRPEHLEEEFKEAGTPKEQDLLKIYTSYEREMKKLGFLDEEDLLWEKIQIPNSIQQIYFEGFDNKSWLILMGQRLEKNNSHLKIKITPRMEVTPQQYSMDIGSLSSTFQEREYVAEEILRIHKSGTPLSEIGVLYQSGDPQFFPLAEYLKRLNFTPVESSLKTFDILYPLLKQWRTSTAAADREVPFFSFADQWEAQMKKTFEERLAEKWHNLSFYHQMFPLPPRPPHQWVQELEEALAEEKIKDPIPEQLEGLQWIDPAEMDRPSLSHLFIPSCLEGIWPRKNRPASFFQDRRFYRIDFLSHIREAFPDAQEQWQEEFYAFWETVAQIKNHTLATFPRVTVEGREGIRSSFLLEKNTEIQTLPSKNPFWICKEERPNTALFWNRLAVEKERNRHQLQNKPFHGLLEEIDWKEHFKNHIFSISQLELYAACPYRFFAKQVLGIPTKKEEQPDVDANDQGTLFHNTMEHLFKQTGDLYKKAISEPEAIEQLKARIPETVEACYQELKDKLSYAHPILLERLKKKTVALAEQLIETELEELRELPDPLFPEHHEWIFGKTQATAAELPSEEGTIYLGGRVDRIDVSKNQKRFLVLDYKTGSTLKSTPKRMAEGLALQLQIYIWAVQQLLLKQTQAVGGLLIQVREAKRSQGLVLKEFNKKSIALHPRASALMEQQSPCRGSQAPCRGSQTLEQCIADALQFTKEYVKKIRNGEFAPDPKDCTTTCDYKEICRYAYKPVD